VVSQVVTSFPPARAAADAAAEPGSPPEGGADTSRMTGVAADGDAAGAKLCWPSTSAALLGGASG